MCRLARPRDPRALDAEGAEDDAEREVERLEHRPLLDVELEIRGSASSCDARLERTIEVDVERPDRIGQRDAVAVDELAELVLVGHRAAGGGRAEQRPAEAGALLVRPVDEPHGDRRRPIVGDAAQHLCAREDVEAAVEPAAVRHGVHVAADQDGALGVASERVPVVSRSVPLDLERQIGERVGEPRAAPRPGLRPGDALCAVLVPGQRAELVEPGHDAGGVERHRPDTNAVARGVAKPWVRRRVA